MNPIGIGSYASNLLLTSSLDLFLNNRLYNLSKLKFLKQTVFFLCQFVWLLVHDLTHILIPPLELKLYSLAKNVKDMINLIFY